MVYFISDLHDQHVNILSYCPETRPFKDVNEQREHIVNSWNSRVTAEDTIYVLGDICMGIKEVNVPKLLSRLNGHKICIVGNHDKSPDKMVLWGFHEAYDKLEVELEGFKVLLQHKPPSEEQYSKFNYILHGHCHGKLDHHSEFKRFPAAVDVGVDATGSFVPKTFSELISGIEPNSI